VGEGVGEGGSGGEIFVGWVEALRNPTPISTQPIVVFYLIHVPNYVSATLSLASRFSKMANDLKVLVTN
jgi:hypothetical protein